MKFIETHKKIWARNFTYSVLVGVVLISVSLVINYFANIYALERVSMPVTDLILSNVRVYDVDGIVIYGALLLIAFAIAVALREPKRIPFVLKSFALFIIIRSIFISLTHLGPFLPQAEVDPIRILHAFGIGMTADLFFSGHTGTPFLLALIYWNNKYLRLIFLVTSVIFAVSVLLGHLHYSIDVFAAYFITYTIFHMAQKFFPADWKLASS